jgi:hypothetical protein
MDFYTSLFLGTVICVIILLVIVGYCMYLSKGNETYPPSIANCPDYYTVDDVSGCIASSGINVTPDCSFNNFLDPKFLPSGTNFDSGNCQKKLWAEKCNVTWDGITNDSNICYN